jgi:hypothetical protein
MSKQQTAVEWLVGITILLTSYTYMCNKVYEKEKKILDDFKYSYYWPSDELNLANWIGAISWLIFNITWLFIYIKFIR